MLFPFSERGQPDSPGFRAAFTDTQLAPKKLSGKDAEPSEILGDDGVPWVGVAHAVNHALAAPSRRAILKANHIFKLNPNTRPHEEQV